MPRFDTGKALNIESSELEKQQKEMLAKTKEREKQVTPTQPEINPQSIILVAPQSTERITLRLPKNIHDSMKLIARFEDKSLNALITQACLEFIAKDENQEKIKKYQKII